jgi:hypothetical protein
VTTSSRDGGEVREWPSTPGGYSCHCRSPLGLERWQSRIDRTLEAIDDVLDRLEHQDAIDTHDRKGAACGRRSLL